MKTKKEPIKEKVIQDEFDWMWRAIIILHVLATIGLWLCVGLIFREIF